MSEISSSTEFVGQVDLRNIDHKLRDATVCNVVNQSIRDYFLQCPIEEYYERFPEHRKWREDSIKSKFNFGTGDEQILFQSKEYTTTLGTYKAWRIEQDAHYRAHPTKYDSTFIDRLMGPVKSHNSRSNLSTRKLERNIEFEDLDVKNEDDMKKREFLLSIEKYFHDWCERTGSDEWLDLPIIDMAVNTLIPGAVVLSTLHWKSKLDQFVQRCKFIKYVRGNNKEVKVQVKNPDEDDEFDSRVQVHTTTCYTSLTGGTYYVHDSVIPLFFLALIGDSFSKNKAHQHAIQETCRGDKNYHVFLDIDSSVDLTIELIHKLIRITHESFMAHHEYTGPAEPVILTNDENPQKKIHIYFPRFITTKPGLRIVLQEVLLRMPEAGAFLDTTASGLRLPYQGKVTKEKKIDLKSMYMYPACSDPNGLDLVDLFLRTKITAYEWEKPCPLRVITRLNLL